MKTILFVLSALLLFGSSPDETEKAQKGEMQSLFADKATVQKLADGFSFTEGPAADKDGNVFFTDQPNNKIYKWSIDGELSVFHDSPERANGMYFNQNGSLIACADLHNKLVSIDMQGNITPLVENYQGKLLNAPNDLWIDPNGGIYFTDPLYKRDYWDRGPMEQDGEHVYYLKPDRKTLIRVAEDFVKPNGIIGTPDGKKLYIADIGDSKIYEYLIEDDGTLSDKKFFAPEGSDGMTIDNQGNVYLTNRAVSIFDKSGKKIQTIQVPEIPSNVCFGGKERNILFITARTSLYAMQMNVKGV